MMKARDLWRSIFAENVALSLLVAPVVGADLPMYRADADLYGFRVADAKRLTSLGA